MMSTRGRDTFLRTLQLGLEWFPERYGGLNRLYYELARQLPKIGVGVYGLVMGSPAVAADSGGAVRAVSPPRAPLALRWWRMRTAIREALRQDPGLLPVVHFAPFAFPAVDLFGERRVVVHFHGPWALEARQEGASAWSMPLRALIEGRVYRRASAFIVLSRAFGRLLHGTYRVPEEKVHVVPGGVNVDRFASTTPRSEARERLGWPADRFIVLSVRRLVHRMGVGNLIEAARLVRTRVPEVLFLIAGTGALADALESQIRALGVEREVRLLGRLDDDQLPTAYRAADVTLVPTVALEGFGLVVPESLAAGTPVLVTPVGGLPEAVEGLSSDVVLNGADPAALADGVLRTARGTLRLPEPDTCRQFARSHFDWSVVARRIADVYAESPA